MEESSSGGQHYQVTFFTRNENYQLIPDYNMSVPAHANAENLNALVNQSLQEVEMEYKPVVFDFLIGSTILRTSLKEFVQENNLPVESIIKIECIVQEPMPKPVNDLSLPDWVGAVKATDEFFVSAAYNGEVTLWSHSGQNKASFNLHNEAIKCLAVFSSNSVYRLISGGHDQDIKVSDISNKIINETHLLCGHERSVECIAVNSECTRMISGGFDSMLKVWNLEDDISTVFEKKENGRASKRRKSELIVKTPMVTLAGHKDAIVGAVWSPVSPKEALTVSWDHTISVWDLELAGQTNTLCGKKAFTGITTCPNNSFIITSSVDPVLRLWDPRSHEGSLVKQSYVGHSGWVSSVFWNQTKDNLFISSSFDKTVKMWDIRSNKTPVYDMSGHSDRVLCCDWSKSEFILSGGADSTLKVFHTNQQF